jgi:NAD(P)-dependent dehydrogenase (short-subunit alcohol dehydrogenase family)
MIPPSAIPNPSAAPSRRWRFSLPSWQFTLQETLGISLAMRKPSLHLTLPLIVSTLAAAAAYAFLPTRKRYHPGQVAVITGGSRGLGLALAHRFGRAGLKLVLAARDADELELARDRILRSRDVLEEDNILLVACDLTDPEQAKALIRSTMEAFGRLDLLVNNAGIIEVGPFENQPLEAYERAMQTNFFAALYTIHAALPYLLDPVDSAEQSCRGIVNIASIGGKIPVPHLLPYVAAKFALTGFSEGLHIEMRLPCGPGRTRRDHHHAAGLACRPHRRPRARDQPTARLARQRIRPARPGVSRARYPARYGRPHSIVKRFHCFLHRRPSKSRRVV